MGHWIVGLIAAGGYWGIALLMALENIIPPIPSELIMGLGGIAASRGHMDLVLLTIAGTVGTVVGNCFWYWVGRKVGYKRLKPFIDRWGRWLTVDWCDVERAYRFFRKHGGWMVFVCRFLPTFRTMISLPAGLVAMPFWRFVVWTAAGSAIWNAFLVWAGYTLGRQFTEIDKVVGPVTIASIALIVLWYLYRIFTWKPTAQQA
ncbi:DedA family protein [Stakelama sediminis]|uniref:Membrane protein DedA with SNARE-associated domain n=1 Tax=Stakelama sediminis TaxID=463200 RepID=A0A840YW35_9SPHN|nr:DedA family protein [Stakelama sediminis]MBB5717770.1 membrane protein DedA with SNARE-associated domain [Stakelama sediminis]